MSKPILCLDFDGTCTIYSGWKGADVIPDPPVEGLFEFLAEASNYFEIHVFSSRTNQAGGKQAMIDWFSYWRDEWRTKTERLNSGAEIVFPDTKPPAFISIDDRAITFTGEWPDIKELLAFKPWFKK